MRNRPFPLAHPERLMNRGGYPWTIIRLESRDDHLEALERASVFQD